MATVLLPRAKACPEVAQHLWQISVSILGRRSRLGAGQNKNNINKSPACRSYLLTYPELPVDAGTTGGRTNPLIPY